MSIEFRCTQCNRLLRTEDDTTGKKAKCPECGTILTIPAPGPPPDAGAPPPGAGPPSPFAPIEPPAASESPFAPDAAPGAENPYASPADYATGAAPPPAPPGALVPTLVDSGDVLGRSWEIYKQQLGMCLGLVLVAGLINFAFNAAAGMIPFVGPIVSMLFSVWIYAGVAIGLLQIARGQPTSLDVIFKGGPYFLKVFVASLLYGLIVQALFAILFVPGLVILLLAMQGIDPPIIIVTAVALGLLAAIPAVIVALMYSQFYYLIVDRDVGILESFSLSKQVTTGNKATLFWIWVLVGLINIAGLLACGAGLLFTVPFTSLVNVVVYLAMTGQPTAGPPYYQPATPPYGGPAGSSPFGSPAG